MFPVSAVIPELSLANLSGIIEQVRFPVFRKIGLCRWRIKKIPAFAKISLREKTFPDTGFDAEPVPGDISDVVNAKLPDDSGVHECFFEKIHFERLKSGGQKQVFFIIDIFAIPTNYKLCR